MQATPKMPHPHIRLPFMAAKGKCPLGGPFKLHVPNVTHHLFTEWGLFMTPHFQLPPHNSHESCPAPSPSLNPSACPITEEHSGIFHLSPACHPTSLLLPASRLFCTNPATPHYRFTCLGPHPPQSGLHMPFQAHVLLNSMTLRYT